VNTYVRLSRLDRPVGILLLMLPCWWGVALASPLEIHWGSYWGIVFEKDWGLLLLFAFGATFMRGAGCIWNDLADRNIDRHVVRTQHRPLATGEISVTRALIYFTLHCMGGLAVLLLLPIRCWPLSLLGLALLATYPFMKRITYWPQLMLGFAFNLGVIFGVIALLPYADVHWPAVIALYGAGITWTIGYDTIYALQDLEDDLKIGVKSTAILFGEKVKVALILIYGFLFGLLGLVGYLEKAGTVFYSLIGIAAFLTGLVLLCLNPHNVPSCLKTFKANARLGWIIWVALLLLPYSFSNPSATLFSV
jgi:4-hydroxybenzoate polyprenyltransferase